MTDDDSSFLREVEQEVRRERLMKMVDKYGVPVLVVVGALILGTGGYFLYQNSVREAAERDGNTYLVAERLLRGDKKAGGKKDLERLARDGSGAYVPLAKMRLAALALDAGKRDEARKLFAEAAASDALDATLRSHAQMQVIALDIDKLDFTQAKNRLSKFLDDQSPWRHSAREMLALVAIREAKFDDARQILTQLLADQDAPRSIRQRVQVLMGLATPPAPAAGSPSKGSKAEAKQPSGKPASPKAATDGKAPAGEKRTEKAEPAKTEKSVAPAKSD